jgi:hypothetical protein
LGPTRSIRRIRVLTLSEIGAVPTASQHDFNAGRKDNQEHSERMMPGCSV